MAYASAEDVQDRMLRTMSDEERDVCEALLEDAAVLIDATAQNAPAAAKRWFPAEWSSGQSGTGTAPEASQRGQHREA